MGGPKDIMECKKWHKELVRVFKILVDRNENGIEDFRADIVYYQNILTWRELTESEKLQWYLLWEGFHEYLHSIYVLPH